MMIKEKPMPYVGSSHCVKRPVLSKPSEKRVGRNDYQVEGVMWKKFVALILIIIIPSLVSMGDLMNTVLCCVVVRLFYKWIAVLTAFHHLSILSLSCFCSWGDRNAVVDFGPCMCVLNNSRKKIRKETRSPNIDGFSSWGNLYICSFCM